MTNIEKQISADGAALTVAEPAFRYHDDLGPAKVLYVYEPKVGLRGIVVVDNVAVGPSIGGVRLAPDVSTDECFRLARAMTFKNAAAGLAHGGGKSVIFGNPAMGAREKEALIRAFARAIAGLTDYIPGPDMGTDEQCMAWTMDEIGRAVGLPPEIGGIPLDEIGATGFGVTISAEVALSFLDLPIDGVRVAIQGFGSVGKHASRFLADKGAQIVAVSDSRGAIEDPAGLDPAELIALKDSGRSVADYEAGRRIDRDDLIGVDCDVWIPAARPDAITGENQNRLKARLVVPGANIPMTSETERQLHDRGVLVVPDFIANAGGVICAAVEYHGGSQSAALQTIEEKIRANTGEVLGQAKTVGSISSEAAVAMAERRVRAAMALRRHF